MLLLPDADEGTLFRRLEAIREACTERLLVHADRDMRFSISVGAIGLRFGIIGTSEESGKAISELFRHVDSAFYMPKEAGGDG